MTGCRQRATVTRLASGNRTVAINLNSRRQLHPARYQAPSNRHYDAHGASDLGATVPVADPEPIDVRTHCLICGRPLPWLSRMLGGLLCYRRECHVEYDQRQP